MSVTRRQPYQPSPKQPGLLWESPVILHTVLQRIGLHSAIGQRIWIWLAAISISRIFASRILSVALTLDVTTIMPT